MSPTICKPSMKGSRSANKVSVGATTRSVIRPLRSSGLIILCDNHKPQGTKTQLTPTLVRYRRQS